MKRDFFDYNEFLEEMKKHPNKPNDKKTVLKYEELFGSQEGLSVRDQPFYKDYLSQFKIPFKVSIPVDGPEDCDWDLLLRFIFGSLSSRYALQLEKEWKENPQIVPKVQLSITVTSGDQQIRKYLDDLWDFQIRRLFEIYLLEQMDLAILLKDEEDAEEGIEFEREEKIRTYRKKSLMVFKEVKAYLTLTHLISTF